MYCKVTRAVVLVNAQWRTPGGGGVTSAYSDGLATSSNWQLSAH